MPPSLEKVARAPCPRGSAVYDYLDLQAVVVTSSNEATNAGLEHSDALHLAMIRIAEQVAATVALQQHRTIILF